MGWCGLEVGKCVCHPVVVGIPILKKEDVVRW